MIRDRIKITLYSMSYGYASFFSVQDSFMVAEMVWCISVWFPFGGILHCPGVYLCDTGRSQCFFGVFLIPESRPQFWRDMVDFIGLGGRLVRSM